MGWNAQPTRQVIFDGVRVPAANRARRGGRRLRHRDDRAQRRPRSTWPPARSAAPSGRSTARCATCRSARPSGRPLARIQSLVSRWPTWRPNSRPPARCCERAADKTGRRGAGCRGCVRAWRSDSPPTPRFDVANTALQLHGGYGYLHEYGIEKSRPRPASAPDPRGNQRDHEADRRARSVGERAMTGDAELSDVIVDERGRLGLITLNRPKAINALTHAMVHADQRRRSTRWADDDAVSRGRGHRCRGAWALRWRRHRRDLPTM